MKYKSKQKTISLNGNKEYFEGTSIEKEMEIATTTKRMPERNMQQIFYTQRKNGVLPETDIRTDRWEYAQRAQNAIALNADKIIKEKQQEKQPEQSQQIDVKTE